MSIGTGIAIAAAATISRTVTAWGWLAAIVVSAGTTVLLVHYVG